MLSVRVRLRNRSATYKLDLRTYVCALDSLGRINLIIFRETSFARRRYGKFNFVRVVISDRTPDVHFTRVAYWRYRSDDDESWTLCILHELNDSELDRRTRKLCARNNPHDETTELVFIFIHSYFIHSFLSTKTFLVSSPTSVNTTILIRTVRLQVSNRAITMHILQSSHRISCFHHRLKPSF